MKPLDFPLLADENIHPEVIRALIREGKDQSWAKDWAVARMPILNVTVTMPALFKSCRVRGSSA